MKYLLLMSLLVVGCSAPTHESLKLKFEDEYRNQEVCDIIYQWKLKEVNSDKEECEKQVEKNLKECRKVTSLSSPDQRKYMSCSNYSLSHCSYDLMTLDNFMARCYGKIRGL